MVKNTSPVKSFLWIILIAGVCSIIYVLFSKYKSLRSQSLQQQSIIKSQNQLVDSLRVRSLSNLMPQILSKVEEELKHNPVRALSEETIQEIAALSYTLTPYARFEGDSMSNRKLSPERGQLLLMLAKLNLDTASYHRILEVTSFAHADLRGANLSGADLNGVDLSSADLYGARLIGADLRNSKLSFSNLWGAQLGQCKLDSADLSRADLRWAHLNGASLKGANFFEADLSSSQMRKVDLSGAVMKYAVLKGAFLNEAILDSADLYRTIVVRAQLPGASLKETNLTFSNLIEANLLDAELSDAIMKDSVWLETIDKWLVTGSKEIGKNYHLVKVEIEGQPYYQIRKIPG